MFGRRLACLLVATGLIGLAAGHAALTADPALPTPSAPADAASAASLAAEALALKHAGDPDGALARAREAAATDPGNAEAHWVAAWVLEGQGETAAAGQEFALFIAAAGDDPRVASARAHMARLATPPATGPQTEAVLSQTPLETLMVTAAVKGIPERLGGGVMVKYKLRLQDGSDKGFKTIFKPRQGGSQSFVYEIAAYRIDRLCRMGNVPVTVKRDLPRSLLAKVKGADLGRVKCSGDLVGGSLQQWVNDSRDPVGSGARRWAEGWLGQLGSPGARIADLSVARQVSDMFLLDYLQGNMDRFSGGNILKDPTGKLWFIDNAEGFGSSPRPRQDFYRVKRFHRRSIDALRAASEADIAREVGPWLSEAQLRGLQERRVRVLDHVDAAVRKYGQEKAYL